MLSFKLFIFHITFLWLTQMITIYVYGILLWNCFIFLVSMKSYFLAGEPVAIVNLSFRCFLDDSRF